MARKPYELEYTLAPLFFSPFNEPFIVDGIYIALLITDGMELHKVEFLQPGDMNHDTEVNNLDMDRFMDALLAGPFDVAADMNGDGTVNGLDVDPFVDAVVGSVQQIPEPSTLLLCLIALGVVGGWRKWRR